MYYYYQAEVTDGMQPPIEHNWLLQAHQHSMHDLLDTQQRELRRLIKFDKVIREKLTLLTRAEAISMMNNRGMDIGSMPTYE